jgi:thiamine-monophosphate kinase
VQEGAKLIAAGVTCAMDVSDGLLGDLEKICQASDVGAIIDVASVPTPKELRAEFSDDALELALTGGEDYELVFTAPFDVMDRLIARNRKMFTHIGRIIEAPGHGPRVQTRGADGKPAQVRRAGWDHLRE